MSVPDTFKCRAIVGSVSGRLSRVMSGEVGRPTFTTQNLPLNWTFRLWTWEDSDSSLFGPSSELSVLASLTLLD